MKIRIKFAKYGSMKFIGHLDVMRFFQKVMRRADVDIAYTAGFSPHQVMSFAAPLGLGITSAGEYVDIEVNSTGSSQEMKERMNAAVLAEGIEILSYVRLPDSAKPAMSIVAAADYCLSFREGYEPEQKEEFFKQLETFVRREQIIVLKKTKKSEKEVDIRPMLYSFEIKDEKIYMRTATGSSKNLKPELVMQAFYEAMGMEWNPFTFQIHRIQVYAEKNPGKKDSEQQNQSVMSVIPELIALEDLGETIE